MQQKYASILLVVVILIIPYICFSQIEKRGFIVTDSAQLFGKILVISDSEIRFTRSAGFAQRLKASEIKQYEYDGQVYESVRKDGSHRFYKRLVNGQVKLYKDDDDFLVINGDTVIMLSQKNFRGQVKKYFSCAKIDQVAYTRPALKNFFNQFNKVKCDIKFIPHARFGVSVGINDLTVMRKIDALKFETKMYTPSIAIFYERQLYLLNGLFATAELSMAYNSADFYTVENSKSYYYQFDNMILAGHIGLKYVASTRYIRPFVKAGVMPSYMSHKPTTEMSLTHANGPVIEMTYAEVADDSKSNWGFYTNLGLEMNIGKQSMIVLEARYDNSTFQRNPKLSWSAVGINLALSF